MRCKHGYVPLNFCIERIVPVPKKRVMLMVVLMILGQLQQYLLLQISLNIV